MKAFVIEQDQIKQYVFGVVGAIVLAFVLGYLLGNGTLMRLVLGDVDQVATQAVEPAPATTAGDVDGKQPEQDEEANKAAQEKQAAEQKAAEEKAAREKAAQEKAAKEKAAREKAAAEKKLAQQRAAEKAAAERKLAEQKAAAQRAAAEKREAARKAAEQKALAEKQAAETAAQDSTAADTATATNQAEAENRRYYSIQAGMFASKTNAMSFIEKLAGKNFEAYMSDFVSSSGTVKYNVRVGRFENRDQARSQLREYQKSFTTPAYVVITQ